MAENVNISLIFPEIALNHCCPNAKSSPPPFLPQIVFCNQIFIRHKSRAMSNHTADVWMLNASQEDHPATAELCNPAPLTPDGHPTTPPALGPWGKPSLLPSQGELVSVILCLGRRTKAGRT